MMLGRQALYAVPMEQGLGRMGAMGARAPIKVTDVTVTLIKRYI